MRCLRCLPVVLIGVFMLDNCYLAAVQKHSNNRITRSARFVYNNYLKKGFNKILPFRKDKVTTKNFDNSDINVMSNEQKIKEYAIIINNLLTSLDLTQMHRPGVSQSQSPVQGSNKMVNEASDTTTTTSNNKNNEGEKKKGEEKKKVVSPARLSTDLLNNKELKNLITRANLLYDAIFHGSNQHSFCKLVTKRGFPLDALTLATSYIYHDSSKDIQAGKKPDDIVSAKQKEHKNKAISSFMKLFSKANPNQVEKAIIAEFRSMHPRVNFSKPETLEEFNPNVMHKWMIACHEDESVYTDHLYK